MNFNLITTQIAQLNQTQPTKGTPVTVFSDALWSVFWNISFALIPVLILGLVIYIARKYVDK
jgi:hypothetical protein